MLRIWLSNRAVTSVIATILVVVMVLSAVSAIVLWSVPYIESRKTDMLYEETESDLILFNQNLYYLSRNQGTVSQSTVDTRGGSIYTADKSSRIVISYTLNDNYNFTVRNLDNIDTPLPYFYVDMTKGEITRAEVYWLKEANCFLPGTKILMADGTTKNIEDIKVGDLVKAFDEKTGEIKTAKVTKVFHHSKEEMGDYYLVINGWLRVTPNHPIYANGKWIEAGKLKVGDRLYGDIKISSIERVYEKSRVFDIELNVFHTYFVLIDDEPILVHNSVEILDQYQENLYRGQKVYDTVYLAQSFTPSIGILSRIELLLRRQGSTENIDLVVTDSLDGGHILAHASKGYNDIPEEWNWVNFDFEDINVKPGREYYIIVSSEKSTSVEYYEWGFWREDIYKGGAGYIYSKGKWKNAGIDFCFRTYGVIEEEPELAYEPQSYDFGEVEEGEVLSTSFLIWNNGTGTLSYNLSVSPDDKLIESVIPSSGESNGERDEIVVTINTSGLAPGTYTSAVNITSNGGNGTFIVEVTVVESPLLEFYPKVIDFGEVSQGYSGTRTFEIWNGGGGTLTYQLEEHSSWIVSVDPSSGSSTGERDTIEVTINTTGLTEGSYTGTIYISSNGGQGECVVRVNVSSAGVKVVYPSDEGIEWEIGKNYTIRWDYWGIDDDVLVSVELWKGDQQEKLIGVTKIYTKSFDWLVENVTPGTDYSIIVRSSTGEFDESDHDFSIIGSSDRVVSIVVPREGEKWRVGNFYTIKWRYAGFKEPYPRINISLENGYTIASYVPLNNSTYTWWIPLNFSYLGENRINITVVNGCIYNVSKKFYITERYDDVKDHETIYLSNGPSYRIESVSTDETSQPRMFNGSVVVELYNDSWSPYHPVAKIWIFDTDSVVYGMNSPEGVLTMSMEMGGLITQRNGAKFILDKPRILEGDNAILIPIIQIKGEKFSASGKLTLLTETTISYLREAEEVFNLKLYIYGENAEVWKDFFSKYSFSDDLIYKGGKRTYIYLYQTVCSINLASVAGG